MRLLLLAAPSCCVLQLCCCYRSPSRSIALSTCLRGRVLTRASLTVGSAVRPSSDGQALLARHTAAAAAYVRVPASWQSCRPLLSCISGAFLKSQIREWPFAGVSGLPYKLVHVQQLLAMRSCALHLTARLGACVRATSSSNDKDSTPRRWRRSKRVRMPCCVFDFI